MTCTDEHLLEYTSVLLCIVVDERRATPPRVRTQTRARPVDSIGQCVRTNNSIVYVYEMRV